jgi:hypothetical protein
VLLNATKAKIIEKKEPVYSGYPFGRDRFF